MHEGKYVFAQIMEQVVRYEFQLCVTRYCGERHVRRFTCFDQLLAMAFGQLSFRESLRDIVVCLNAHKEKLYHLGFRSSVVRATLADANERRDWRIYRDYAQILMKKAGPLYAKTNPSDLGLEALVYLLDSTTIELCLSLFPWARLVKKRASIKLNMGLNLAGNIPSFFDFSSGREHDVHFLDRITFEPGAYYIMDRGYGHLKRFFSIHRAGAFFVTRLREDLTYRRLYSHPTDKSTGVRSDQTIVMTGAYTGKDYPEKLRRISFYDKEADQRYVFLTNAFDLPATTIAKLYKCRWQIELFFKWVKQHLSIKTFWGRSENAVKVQICIALCTYLLVAIMKKQRRVERNSYEILQILSVSLFDKLPLTQLISRFPIPWPETNIEQQLNLLSF